MFSKNNLQQELGTEKQTFLVTTAILEGRHYAWPNMDSLVTVQAFGKKETTAVVQNSDCPYYNEYFTFEKKATPDEILHSDIVVAVIQPRSVFRGRKVLGSFKLDIATLWDEPDHQFYNKWGILTAPPKKYISGARGYLKVNITLITKNISPSIPPTPKDIGIEGNLLLPHSMLTERSKAHFQFSIYKAEHLYINGKAPTSCVEVSFAGNKVKTTPQKNTSFPDFNQRLILRDMFPPLSQSFHLKIFFGKSLYAWDSLNVKYLTSYDEEGQLPRFGLSFLHFYDNGNMEEYKGSLLFGVETKLAIEGIERKKQNNIYSIGSCSQDLFPLVQLRLYCIIFECSALDKRFDGNVIFRVTIGVENTEKGDLKIRNITEKIYVQKINRSSRFLVIKEKKPLLSLALSAIDYRKKLYNYNMLDKITDTMEKKLESIGILFTKEERGIDQEISDNLVEILDYLHSSTKKYLDIATNYSLTGMSPLDKSKIEDNLKTLEYISNKAKEILNPLALRRTFLKTRKLCDQLIRSSQYINDTWPDVFITVWKDNKKLGYIRIPCKELLHSQIEEEKGILCGNMATLYLQAEKKKTPRTENVTSMIGKMEVLLWLGAEKFANEFLKNLPLGFEEVSQTEESLFRYVTTEEVHIFQCRCHLFQGRVNPGLDSTALSDTMVRIHIGDDCQESTIEQQTLNPVWNQTLIFKRVTLYGDISFIKSNPTSIVVELLDRDNYFFWEFIGKTSVKPLVKAKAEPYGPPNFPPELKWIKVFGVEGVSADILASFEMLEITGDLSEGPEQAEKDIIRIPVDIIPDIVDFRLEVLFWGVRNLKKVQMRMINKPRITLECVKTIFHSDTLEDARKNSNFKETVKMVDLQLPSNFEYASPLVIRMMDKRTIGTYVLAGIFVSHLKAFRWSRITEEQRQDLLMGKVRYHFMSEVHEDVRVEDSDIKITTPKPQMTFVPQHCFCRTSQTKKLVKNISKIRCICKKTKWQKFRQKFNKKKIICPCLEEYQKKISKVEEEHKKTCSCCRKLLEKLHLAASDRENEPGYLDIFRSPCFGGKCGCCGGVAEKIRKICSDTEGRCLFCQKISGRIFKKKKEVEVKEEVFDDRYDDSEYDWWTKYYASLEPEPKPNDPIPTKMKYRLKIYTRELESLPEFEYFKDQLMSFPMFKGKRTGDEIIDREMVTGIFKGAIKMYKWPSSSGKHYVTRRGQPLSDGYFSYYPSNDTINFVLRVYCVKAIHLPPKDISGKCDPYLLLRLDDKEVNDRDDYRTSELNPVFGKMYKFQGFFPKDHTLLIQVWDRDVTSRDDLIGETVIDVENRLYTEHRASCGIPELYEQTGYCAWRDQVKPSKILKQLCIRWNLPKPEYAATSVQICSKVFESPNFESSGSDKVDRDIKALYALRNWHEVPYIGLRLVPEHVETRSLFHPKKAFIEQGKLQLWIDIFPTGDFPPPPPVDISVKPPVPYELRVIIWNTADVLLQEDDFFTNQKKSDIFVKGMLLGHENVQNTDVHYRSLTGEGNFNWRFIFPMEYLLNEDKTVIYPDGGTSSSKQNGMKFPCRLTIQVWENDILSKDDFLGTLNLDLSRMPRGAKTPEQCSLALVEPYVPHINIFKMKRTKGWWPFKGYDLDENMTIVGKVEIEFEMLTSEEAQKNPAGLGRNAPQPLLAPKRFVPNCERQLQWLEQLSISCSRVVAQYTTTSKHSPPLKMSLVVRDETSGREGVLVDHGQSARKIISPCSYNNKFGIFIAFRRLVNKQRPDTSFNWLLNPWKGFKHVVCKLHRWKCICCCCWLLLFVFAGLAIYAFPGYFVKKILRV